MTALWVDYLRIALLLMRARPVRSALSWLGIYIGVLALIVVLALHEGTRRQLDTLYRIDGARVVLAHPNFDRQTKRLGRLSLDDAERLRASPGILSVHPRLTEERTVRSDRASQQCRMTGIDEYTLSLYRIPVVDGRGFLAQEISTKQSLCLLTESAVEELFPFGNPLQATLDVQGTIFQVIGIVAWNAEVNQRYSGDDPKILVPYSCLINKRNDFIGSMEVRVTPEVSPKQAEAIVTQALSRGDPARAKRYMIRPLEQMLEKKKALNEQALYSLLAIAGISLLVGGIGIANVILTSVTERTREIGLRKALGATRKDILFQFLVEACVLCSSGGLGAILTGIIGMTAWSSLFPDRIAVVLPAVPLTICFLLTLLVGVVAGLYPASRAADLSPAEALRSE